MLLQRWIGGAHGHNHEGIMMGDTLRHDNERGSVGKWIKEQSRNKAWRGQGDQQTTFQETKQVRLRIEHP